MPPADPTSVDRCLTAPQVCAVVGITSRQLSWWTRTVLVDPATEPAPARRAQRQYSYADLVMLMVVKRLLDAGLSMGAARSAMERLRPPIANFETANLVVDERGSRLAYSGDEIMDLLKRARLLHIIPLRGIASELAALSPTPVSKP